MERELLRKYEQLKTYLKELGSVAIAFSGGVDSTFLLKTAHDVLGDHVIAVTARSCSFPVRELNEATVFCKSQGIKHIVCDSEELDIEGFSENPINRCYLCKTALFTKIWEIANQRDIPYVAEGSNTDDDGDYRPGLIAVEEQQVVSPLRTAQLSKEEIRKISKEIGLSTWDKQSFACLSSRFVYGEVITESKLKMVEQAEQILLDEGFIQVRVRIHDYLARIEIDPAQFALIMEPIRRQRIYRKFQALGFSYISLDLGGYRTGSMNETLDLDQEASDERSH